MQVLRALARIRARSGCFGAEFIRAEFIRARARYTAHRRRGRHFALNAAAMWWLRCGLALACYRSRARDAVHAGVRSSPWLRPAAAPEAAAAAARSTPKAPVCDVMQRRKVKDALEGVLVVLGSVYGLGLRAFTPIPGCVYKKDRIAKAIRDFGPPKE